MYRLVNEVYQAHEGPVRSLCIGPLGEVCSGDSGSNPQCKRWLIANKALEMTGSPLFHDHWVVAVTSLPPSVAANHNGFIITGCMDSKIRIFDSIGNPVMMLEGHQKGVISFSWTASGQLISGSWDGTAKVWALDWAAHQGNCVMTLGPHENGVQVLGLPDGNIATTSTGEAVNDKPANFKLRIWDGRSGRQIGDSVCDHNGPIRGIVSLPGLSGLVTCSNDGTVALRGIDGTLIDTMQHPPQEDGSPPFVLGCTSLSSSSGLGIVSCGEDGSVMVWEGSVAVQTIMHPSCVWCAVGVPDTEGDFITGDHEGVLRYFTRTTDAAITDSEQAIRLQENFAEAVAAAQVRKRTGPSQEEINKVGECLNSKWEGVAITLSYFPVIATSDRRSPLLSSSPCDSYSH